jgi:hypothetical protein
MPGIATRSHRLSAQPQVVDRQPGNFTPPPASLATDACDMVNTDARFKVKDVGKFNFFIC